MAARRSKKVRHAAKSCSGPAFDPNEPGKAKPEHRFNYAVAGTFEPGSTFKAITCAGAINSHLVTPNTEIWCENGLWKYGDQTLIGVPFQLVRSTFYQFLCTFSNPIRAERRVSLLIHLALHPQIFVIEGCLLDFGYDASA